MKLDESLTSDILDSLGEGVFTVDKDFRINFFNKAAERITGFKREDVIGKFCKQVFRSKLCVEKCPISQVLQRGENNFDVASIIRHKNGERIRIRLNAAVLRNRQNQEPVGGVISLIDLSQYHIFNSKAKKEDCFYGIVGVSKAMREIFTLIEEIADSDASVLIQGESGTGKELVANAIQATSNRKSKSYIKINCSVFPSQLLASELFGHVKGAFTGAIKNRVGRFELANNGTIFLDEVAEMPSEMQIQLLRVLQEGTFERVGESITRKVDVRVIGASNKNLETAIKQGEFREDLYYRLNVIPIEIPPLRERMEDVPYLIEYFLKRNSTLGKKTVCGIENNALEILLNYPWPGNVRQLENVLEYAITRTKKQKIDASVLPPFIREYVQGSNAISVKISSAANHSPEKESLAKLLETYQWNRSRVAKELGIGRTTLWRKMKALNLI